MTMQPSPVFELRIVLTADDYDAAVQFWRDAVGLPLIREFIGPGGGGSLLAAGQATIEVLSRETAAEIEHIETGKAGQPLTVRLALEVADSEELAEELAGAGVAVGAPADTPWGHRNVRLRTPEGLAVTLFTVPPADQAR